MQTRTRRRRPSAPRLAEVGAVADPAAPPRLDPAQAYALDGWLQLRREDLRRALAIVSRHPELRVAAVGGLRSRVTIRPALVLLTPPDWDRVHTALLACAALATTGKIRVSCDTWDAFIHATDARRVISQRRAVGG
ncbi:MAG: hypothetical protein CVU56_26185 [Deltaproteobacteria bacterium HGW-Deltaproteobacteria-14]|jgi:hypothetical protein|nr:MAG: hypothetical protein CVU56_26185 [Deltaproteobacteria bacterium HGW-Deltaproteobacteria-14]